MNVELYQTVIKAVTKISEYIMSEVYELDINEMRFHQEIYVSDVRKTAAEKIKTVIRHPIKKKA